MPDFAAVSAAAPDYFAWIDELKQRFRATQIKAAVAVNSALLEFYWDLGRDIAVRYAASNLGNDFYRRLSADLKAGMPDAAGLSPQTLKYCGYFYRLYSGNELGQQVVDPGFPAPGQQVVDLAKRRQSPRKQRPMRQLASELFSVPWGHHVVLIDKCKGDREKALFYVRRTIQNGWSRNILLNWLSTDLYEREGRAQTNFASTMPAAESDLARQLIKDPQVFEVFGLAREHDERQLKDAIVANIESTLLSLGRGVAFLGREYPVDVGGETKYIDLLFYVVPLHRYLVVEVKTGKYEAADLGQLSGYMALARRVLNGPGDNAPIGLLVCKEHNRVFARYHLDEISLPMGITDYELRRVLPSKAQLSRRLSAASAPAAP